VEPTIETFRNIGKIFSETFTIYEEFLKWISILILKSNYWLSVRRNQATKSRTLKVIYGVS